MEYRIGVEDGWFRQSAIDGELSVTGHTPGIVGMSGTMIFSDYGKFGFLVARAHQPPGFTYKERATNGLPVLPGEPIHTCA